MRLQLAGCFVDALEVERSAQAGVDTLAPDRVRALLALFGGDLLEGLEVDRCPEFMGWLLAERRRFRALRVALLKRLIGDTPNAECLGHIEKWLELEPLDIQAHERLLGALARSGRFREGEEHLVASVRLFSAEGLDSSELRKFWRAATVRRSFKPTSGDRSQAPDY